MMKKTYVNRPGSVHLWCALAATAALLNGCGSLPDEDGDMRHTSGGAPAELQMACADEGARYYDVAPDDVIPGSSVDQGDGMYDVTLMVGGRTAVCTVDREGNVRSIMDQ